MELDEIIVPAKADPNIIGQDPAIYDLDARLGAAKKAAPVVISPAGSGKSAAIDHTQHLIETGSDIVSNMHGKKIFYLDVNKLIAGTTLRGSLEARFDAIEKEIRKSKNSDKILVIDELENVLKSKEGLQFIEHLKQYMSGEMNGAKFTFNIIPEAYEELMKDPQLMRRMAPFFREPPSDDTVRNILHVLAQNHQKKKGVELSDDQLEQIFRLSKMHPDLANPDVAITILSDTINMVLKDRSSGPRAIVQLRTDLDNYKQTLESLRRSREQNTLKFFGPFFSFKEKRYEDLIERGEKILESYNNSREKTASLREDLDNAINERAGLYTQIEQKKVDENFGDVDPLDRVKELNSEIENLSNQIVEHNPMLVGITPSKSHIQSAAKNNLGKSISPRQIQDEMDGGVGSKMITNRAIIQDSRLERNKIIVESIVERVLVKRRFQTDHKNLPAFLIIDPHGSQQADALIDGLTRELYEQDKTYLIDGSEITNRHSMNNHIGSDSGTINSEKLGGVFKAAKDTNSFMTLVATKIEQSTGHLTDFIGGLITSGTRQSNRGDRVSFEQTSIFMTTSHPKLKLTPEQLKEFNTIKDTIERQDFLRAFVRDNFSGKSESGLSEGYKLSDNFLNDLNIIYLDEATDLSKNTLIANQLKSTKFKNGIERMNFSLDFDESVINFLSDRMRQLGGESGAIQKVETELYTEINHAFEAGIIVPGDVVVLKHDKNKKNKYVFNTQEWDNPSIRDELVAANRARFGSSGAVETATPDPVKDLEDFLQEMSKIQ